MLSAAVVINLPFGETRQDFWRFMMFDPFYFRRVDAGSIAMERVGIVADRIVRELERARVGAQGPVSSGNVIYVDFRHGHRLRENAPSSRYPQRSCLLVLPLGQVHKLSFRHAAERA